MIKSNMIIYKAKKNLLPEKSKTLFKKSPDSRHYMRQSNNIREVYARTTLKSQGIKIWNSLDGNIKCSKIIYVSLNV